MEVPQHGHMSTTIDIPTSGETIYILNKRFVETKTYVYMPNVIMNVVIYA